MNPNALEHQPDVARPAALIKYASDKMFSDPDDEMAIILNKRIAALDELNFLRGTIEEQNARLQRNDPVPAYPLFAATSKTEGNVFTGIRINSKQGLHALDIKNGTPVPCTQAYLEHICHYANRWHSLLSGVDCHSPGTDPKFFTLTQDFHKLLVNNTLEWMADRVSQRLSRDQFWKLRYLFIPISFYPPGQRSLHVALCSISPEAKTVDYLCSGGDNAMPISPQPDGCKALPRIFAWLAYYLEDDMLPFQWRWRTEAGHLQRDLGGDCGIYTVTTAMGLAFGYDLHAFPSDHQAKILSRRRKYVQDLLSGGFELWNLDPESPNRQYYPLIDTKPSASVKDHFHQLPDELLHELPHHIAIRRKCYVDCPSKALLKMHCRRNGRFYPGYDSPRVSGPHVLFEDLLKWVEEMDHMRRTKHYKKGCRPLSYPRHGPMKWIDPRMDAALATHAIPRRALWHAEDEEFE